MLIIKLTVGLNLKLVKLQMTGKCSANSKLPIWGFSPALEGSTIHFRNHSSTPGVPNLFASLSLFRVNFFGGALRGLPYVLKLMVFTSSVT